MQKATNDTGPGQPGGAAGPTVAAPSPAPDPAPARKPAPRRLLDKGLSLRNIVVALLGPLLAVAAGTWFYLSGGRYVSTDNAYVKAYKIAVSPDISGRVVAVTVEHDQPVAKGQPLFRIDPEPHRIALERAEARFKAVILDAEALKALYAQRMARRAQAEGDLAFHAQAHERQMALGKKGVVSQSGMDTAEKNLRNARDQMTIAEQEIAEVRAKLGGDPEAPAEQHPAVREARAQRDQAALDLARTEVRAPAGGVVTNFDLQPGEYVTAGKVVFSLVSDEVWIQANFKETELTHVKPGQPATVHVDTYPDNDRIATVASISSATGAEFAVLPPQNATGNWVKVVQRLPVRLKLEPAAGEPRLKAGMSVVVTIDTGHKRQLPRWARSVLGMAAASPRRAP